MQRLSLVSLTAAAILAAGLVPASAQGPKILGCPIVIAHGCSAEKCEKIGQMPTFRIDMEAKTVCYSIDGTPCTGGEKAEFFEARGGITTIGVGSQRMVLAIDDKMKLRGARLSALGVAAFFSDCKAM